MTGIGVMRQAFKERNFARYVAGNSISLVGNWIQRTTIAWLMWELTGSASWLGLVAFADLFPAILIGPFAGVLADRVSRRNIILAGQLVMLMISLVMACLAWGGLMDRWALLGLTLLHGCMVGIVQPARLAFVSALIPVSMLGTAVAINSIIFNTARFIGPAMAGILLASVGAGWTFFANSLTYLPFLAALVTLHLPVKAKIERSSASVGQSILEGVRFLLDDPVLRRLLGLFLGCSILVRPVSELLPAVADGTFGRGAIGLAWMSGALGVGAMIGGYTLAARPQLVSLGRYRYWLLISAFAASGFMLARPFELAVLAIAACGFCFVVAGVGANTIIQLRAPDELRGRVLSLYGIIIRASPAVGALSVGAAADVFGLVTAVCASCLIFIAIFSAIELRQVRH